MAEKKAIHKRKKYRMIKADKVFVEEIEKDIILERIKHGFDEKPRSIERITAAIRRCKPQWNQIKDRIINEELKDD